MCCCASAHAIILFGLDNAANQTDPGTGVPFDAVARVSNTAGTTLGGTAIHIGDGWMLTANHVGPFDSATFDGVSFYQRDLSVPTVQLGTADLKLYRLTAAPTVSAVNVYSGSAEHTGPATLIGWGRGRDTSVPINSNSVTWSTSDATSAKRWGLNKPVGYTDIAYSGYDFQSTYTILGSDTGVPSGLGENEAAVLMLDSGAGMFQQIGGVWYLIGVAVTVEVSGTSLFGNDDVVAGRGHANYFARISPYSDDIMQATGIPEPSIVAVTGFFAMLLLTRRQRNRG